MGQDDARFEDDGQPPGPGGGGGPPARRSLPVRETAVEVTRTFLDLARHLPTVALVPFTATFLAQGAVVLWRLNPLAPGNQGQVSPLLLVAVIVMIAAYVMFLVDWHRLVILGPGPETTRPRLRLGRRDLRFFGYGLLVGVLGILASLPVAFIAPGLANSQSGTIVLLLLGLLLNISATMAFGLVLPAAATDRNYAIGASFQATKEVLPQILALVALTVLPGLVIVAGVNSLYALAFGPDGPMIPGMLISLALEYGLMALAATLLSVIFKRRAGIRTSA